MIPAIHESEIAKKNCVGVNIRNQAQHPDYGVTSTLHLICLYDTNHRVLSRNFYFLHSMYMYIYIVMCQAHPALVKWVQ